LLGIDNHDLRVENPAADKLDTSDNIETLLDGNGSSRQITTIMEVNSAQTSGLSNISLANAPRPVKASLSLLIKIGTTFVIILVAIYWPGFESVMSFLGAFSAFVICVHTPILANLVMNKKEMSYNRILFEYFLLAVSTGAC